MDIVTRLNGLHAYQKALFSHIELNFGGLVGIAVITSTPKLIDLAQAPLRLNIEGLDLDALQCLGVASLQKDRQPRANELIAMAKRLLVCSSIEFCADFLCRASKISVSGKDPYEEDNNFSTDIKDLWNSKIGKAGSLIDVRDREFFEKCVAPLRNCIRHNNGRLFPEKSVVYAGHPHNKPINVSFEWKQNEKNEIILQLSAAYEIFTSIRDITGLGIKNALKEIKAGTS